MEVMAIVAARAALNVVLILFGRAGGYLEYWRRSTAKRMLFAGSTGSWNGILGQKNTRQMGEKC
jgi:hypothetical protein